jgi:hypothetical protein
MAPVNQPLSKAQRRGWGWIGIGLLAIAVALGAFIAAPLFMNSNAPAPSQIAAKPFSQGLTASPSQGGTETQVNLRPAGLPPSTNVLLFGGSDQNRLQQLAESQTDGEGNLAARVMVPEWAERGKPFYFAAEVEGRRLGLAGFNVIVNDEVAPSGAGGLGG